MSANPLDNDLEPAIIDSGLKAESVPMTPPPAGADNYEVGEEIARGGMASVLEAGDTKLKRTVAIKVMHLEAEESHSARQRFLREAEVLAMLAHPNIVPIYDIVWENGVPLFYSMKMVKGRTLQAILNGLRREEPDVLRDYTLDRLLLIFRKVCDAMAFAHSRGIIHRDLKPENVMVGEFGEVLVMDWGLAKTIREGDEETMRGGDGEALSLSDGLNVSLSQQTLQGSVMGTPKYMSPEQAQGRIDELDERSDLFSLGGILYTILTLRPPVEGTTLEEVLERVKTAEIAEPSHITTFQGMVGDGEEAGDVLEAKRIKPLPHTPTGRVPSALSSVVMKALQREKAERYASVVELGADIEKFQGGFATSAEEAGALKQVRLLMLRHRAVTAALAAMLVLSVGFMIKVMASERRATESAEDSRRSLARAQTALAEAAYRTMDSVALAQALDAVPADLRDDAWDYFSRQRDRSEGGGAVAGIDSPLAILAIPGEPGCFLLAGARTKMKVFNSLENRVERSIETELKGPKICALSGDGRMLAVAGGGSDSVRLFDPGTGVLFKELEAPTGLYRLALNETGSLLLANTKVDRRGQLALRTSHLIETQTGDVRWSREHTLYGVGFHPDGERLVSTSGGVERNLLILSVADGRTLVDVPGYRFLSQAVSPDGRVIATGTHDGDVLLIDATDGRILEQRRLHPSSIGEVAWTRGGKLLTLGDQGRNREGRWLLRVWSVPAFESVDSMLGLETNVGPPVCALCPETGRLLTRGKELRIWKLAVDQERDRSVHSTEQGRANAFVDEASLVARDGFGLALYTLSQAGQPVKKASALPPVRFSTCAVHWPTGRLAVATRNGGPKEFKFFQNREGELIEEQAWGLPSLAAGICFDGTGGRIAMTVPLAKDHARVLDVETGATLVTLPERTEALVFAGLGSNLVAAMPGKITAEGAAYDLLLADGETGEILRRVRVPWRVGALAATPDRTMIAVGGSDMRVHFFDATTLEETGSFRAHDADVTALRFHPTLPVIATGSLDRSVKVWNYQTPVRQRHLFRGLDGTVAALAFNPSGTLLAVDGKGPAFRVFEVQASGEGDGGQ